MIILDTIVFISDSLVFTGVGGMDDMGGDEYWNRHTSSTPIEWDTYIVGFFILGIALLICVALFRFLNRQ